MFSDYKAQVLSSYKKKRDAGIIALNLQHPTPAKLKAECLLVFQTRRSKADLEILRYFVGEKDDDAAYERAIKSIETDKFKPLLKFLRGEIKNTNDKNIELLSWLIDFNPRPYRFGDSHIAIRSSAEGGNEEAKPRLFTSSEKLVAIPIEDLDLVSGIGFDNAPNSGKKLSYFGKYKKHALIGLGLLVVCVMGVSFNPDLKNSFSSLISNNPQCMYWSGDYYEGIACDQKPPNVQVIASDEFKLKHFKRITRRDTLTYRDINKVWYASVNKQLEFYTSEGIDPRMPERRLRPMSKYIYEKYILKKYVAPK